MEPTTHTGTRLPSVVCGASLLLLPALLALVGGCSSSKSNLTLRSIEDGQKYSQRFSKAYATRGSAGNYDIVLLKDSKAENEEGSECDVRQVMHVRVLWQPLPGAKPDHPSATNAVLHWYVLGENGGDDAAAGFVEYEGAGFVVIDRSGKTAKLSIRNASLKPTGAHGAVCDPIGPTRLSGTVVARMNQARVNELLSDVQVAMTEIVHADDAVTAGARQQSVDN